MSFATLGLRAELCLAVSEHGYTTPTPIQERAIPAILAGQDVLAAAQTGTGKTAGFALPMLQRLAENDQPLRPRAVRALVLTPTRELAAQVRQSFKDYGSGLKLRSAVIFGGVGIHPQIQALARGLDVLVATPGRLLDHLQQGTCVLDRVEILVLDEADRMLDMGFIRDIKKSSRCCPKSARPYCSRRPSPVTSAHWQRNSSSSRQKLTSHRAIPPPPRSAKWLMRWIRVASANCCHG